jgi:acetyl esterase
VPDRDDDVLDPAVAEWLAANPHVAIAFDDFDPELLALARGPVGFPSTRTIAHVDDDVVEGVPVRVYRHDAPPTGLVVYFHGGGFVIGSIGIMDNVARGLANATGAVVVSVEYRHAPENPYPAALDDCETVTRWALANAPKFDVAPGAVAVAGDSAGGNLAAAVALRLRDTGADPLAAQILIYPPVAGEPTENGSRQRYDGIVLSRSAMVSFWTAYCGGRDLRDEPYAVPLRAPSLAGLPPAIVVLGGCDPLRDEGREYAARLRAAGVDVEEACFAGQPHGFINFDLPAAGPAHERIGAWLRPVLRAASTSA